MPDMGNHKMKLKIETREKNLVWKRRMNKELYEMFNNIVITNFTKSRRLQWLGCLEWMNCEKKVKRNFSIIFT